MSREEHWRLRLAELLQHLKVSQAAFARETGIDTTYVSRLLYPEEKKGRKNLGLDTMRTICSTYKLRTDWFDLELGSELPGLYPTQQLFKTANTVSLPLPGVEEPQAVYSANAKAWPFKDASYQRLMALKKILGRDYQLALRDIEENIETAILKWEVRSATKKGHRQSA